MWKPVCASSFQSQSRPGADDNFVIPEAGAYLSAVALMVSLSNRGEGGKQRLSGTLA
jgi:hypothetical protein